MKQLQGKVAIVTGAGRGIGRAISIAYAREGAKVVVASRTPSTVDKVVREIRQNGDIAIGVPTDVSQRDQVFAMVDVAVREFGGVDILVNNAQAFGTPDEPQAVVGHVPVEETNEEEWEFTFRTGATATLWGMKAVFPHMKDKGGKVINFGSVAGVEGWEGVISYNATKEAVRAMTRTAAREWGKYGINVNVVNPMLSTRSYHAMQEAQPEYTKAFVDSIPMGRMGDLNEDGCPAFVFLASSASNFITGMTFMLDGGLSIKP